MSLNAAMMASAKQDWNTPGCVLDRVRLVAPIALDPCGNENSIVGAWREFRLDRGEDGLALPWMPHSGGGLVFVNPPYSTALKPWMAKCWNEAADGAAIVALVPARTDTGWFGYPWSCQALCFWRSRLRFLGAPSSAPFPSAVALWTTDSEMVQRFQGAFSDAGHVVLP